MFYRIRECLDLLWVGRIIYFWRTRIHPLVRVLVVLAVVGGLGVFLHGPFRHWRAEGKVTAASEALAENRYVEAREHALNALRAGVDVGSAYATLLRACIALDGQRQAEVASVMIFRDDVSAGDRCLAWEVLCERAPAPSLVMMWRHLLATGRESEVKAHALFDRLIREGRADEAIEVLKSMPESESNAWQERDLQALHAIGSPEAFDECIGRIVNLLIQRPAARERWLGFFDRIPFEELRSSQALTMTHALIAAGPIEGRDLLRLGRCQIRLAPHRADELIGLALTQTTALDPAYRARWCLDLGRSALAAEQVPVAPPCSDRLKLQWRILLALGDMEAKQRFLALAPMKVSRPWEADLLREKSALLEGRKKDADKARAEALRGAVGSLVHDAPAQLALMAEHFGLEETAALAWREVVVQERGPIPFFSRLGETIRFLAEHGYEDTLFSLLAEYRVIEPDNPVVAAQYDYLACLQGRLEPADLVAAIVPIQIQQADPEALNLRSILSLGYLLLERPQEAREISDSIPAREWRAAGPVHRAIRALALKATGDETPAEELMEGVEWDRLLPSERRVLDDLRG